MGSSTRRSFIRSALAAGAGATASSLVGGAAGAGAAPTAKTASGPLLDLAAAQMPYRQDDPRWAKKLMWDRKQVIKVAREFNHFTSSEANSLLYRYEDGNNIGNEGCMLTCLAMVMRLLHPQASPVWSPATLNRAAQDALYYSRSGLSMVTLYPDLVSEMTDGNVQLAISQDYLPGMKGWPRMYTNTAPLLRAYMSLSPAERTNFLVMVKTGTYDDTVASHYVLLNPNAPTTLSTNDAELLDPAMPLKRTGSWKLSDSAAWITQEPQIKKAWEKAGIRPTQIGGAWVFSRWASDHSGPLTAPLVNAWAQQLASG